MKLVLLVLFSILAINALQAEDSSKATKVKQKASETVDATKEYASEKKEQFQSRMKKDLENFDAEIERLKEKSKSAVGSAKQEIEDQLRKVEAQRVTVAEKMGELSRSSGDAWKDVKKGVESAYSEMKNAFKKASSHFKK